MGLQLDKARTLLEEAFVTARLPVLDRERAATMLLQHAELRRTLADLIAFHEGHAEEHAKLVELVAKLLASAIPAKNGSLDWPTELPKGTAPAFRRALNDIIRHMRGN